MVVNSGEGGHIRMENGKKMEEILRVVGPAGATIEKEGQWDFAVYIEETM